MKKSTLKEAIKTKIKSLLSENQANTADAFRTLRTILAFIKKHDAYPYPELMEKAIDVLQAAEVSRMMDRERGLNESLNPEVTTALNRFIKAMARKYDYEEQDAVYAIMAALEQRKSDTKYDMPGFGDTMDALDDISIREEDEKLKYPEEGEVVFYEGEPHEVMRIVRHNDGQGPRIYIRPKEESAILGKKDTFWVRPGDIEGTDLREEEEPTSAELKKKDSIAATSNKLQKLTKKMKDKAKEFKAAEGDAKDKIKDELKKMTKEKKQLEKAL